MKWKLVAILLFIAVFLTACGYIVVEDPNRQTIGSIFLPAAYAESDAHDARVPAPRETPTPISSALPEDGDAKEEDPALNVPIVITRDGKTKDDTDGLTPNDAAEEEVATVLLARGVKGEEVKKLQEQLRVLGFLNGKADGSFGGQTESAVKLAQQYLQAQKDAEAREMRNAMRKELSDMAARVAEHLNALIPQTLVSTPEATDSQIAPNPTVPSTITLNPIVPKDVSFANISADLHAPKKTTAFVADGVVSEELRMYLDNAFEEYAGDMKRGAAGADVRRLQTRLNNMYYLLGGIDGQYGSNTESAVKYYQKFNGLEQTGVADEKMQRMLFSESCKLSDYPQYEYRVEIDISKQKVYVYKWNFGAYNKLVKTMTCSTGTKETPTPLGSFKMAGPCGRWYYFKEFECWAQYAYRIRGGILFHSVLFSEKDTATLRQGSVNALGSRASHGCVRLSVNDAKWLYNTVPAGTTCDIYN